MWVFFCLTLLHSIQMHCKNHFILKPNNLEIVNDSPNLWCFPEQRNVPLAECVCVLGKGMSDWFFLPSSTPFYWLAQTQTGS